MRWEGAGLRCNVLTGLGAWARERERESDDKD